MYKVTIKHANGVEEHFGYFKSRQLAQYNTILAKCGPNSTYNTQKYDGAEWCINFVMEE